MSNNNTKVSGVYQIRNKINGHCYVGSAINIGKRWLEHTSELNRNKHGNRHLQFAWNKYGAGAFEFSILETCFFFALISEEQVWIDKLKPKYNLSPTAGSSLGVKHTAETRARMAEANRGKTASIETRMKMSESMKATMTPERIAKISEASKGHTVSAETRAKISAAAMGNKRNVGRVISAETRAKITASLTGKKASPETRAKLSESHKGKKQSPETVAKRVSKITGHKGAVHTPETLARIAAANRGRKHTPEARSKISIAGVLNWVKRKAKKEQDHD
jgi:hypothetical protein